VRAHHVVVVTSCAAAATAAGVARCCRCWRCQMAQVRRQRTQPLLYARCRRRRRSHLRVGAIYDSPVQDHSCVAAWLAARASRQRRSSPAALRRELGQLLGVASVHNMKFLLLALKSGSADLLIE
jgi:hypothetical protein